MKHKIHHMHILERGVQAGEEMTCYYVFSLVSCVSLASVLACHHTEASSSNSTVSLTVCHTTVMASGREVNFSVTSTFFRIVQVFGNTRLPHQDNLNITYKSNLITSHHYVAESPFSSVFYAVFKHVAYKNL